MGAAYKDKRGFTFEVNCAWLGNVPNNWWTTYVTNPYSLRRNQLADMPRRDTEDEAQRDLDEYARVNDLKLILR